MHDGMARPLHMAPHLGCGVHGAGVRMELSCGVLRCTPGSGGQTPASASAYRGAPRSLLHGPCGYTQHSRGVQSSVKGWKGRQGRGGQARRRPRAAVRFACSGLACSGSPGAGHGWQAPILRTHHVSRHQAGRAASARATAPHALPPTAPKTFALRWIADSAAEFHAA